MFQTKLLEKIRTLILSSITVPEIRAIYKIIWQNMVETDRPCMTSGVAPCMVGPPETRGCSP